MSFLTWFVLSFALAQGNTKTIFFGGYRSTPKQMECWSRGMKLENHSVTAINYPPGAGAGLNRQVEKLASYKALQSEILKNPTSKYKVGGHSSGSQYANNLVGWMLEKGIPAANIQLSNLDGFRASQNLRRKVRTKCWSATNGKINSNNYSPDCEIFRANHCQTKWCLHFSLVNLAVPRDLAGGSDFVRRGYGQSNCQTNIGWIAD